MCGGGLNEIDEIEGQLWPRQWPRYGRMGVFVLSTCGRMSFGVQHACASNAVSGPSPSPSPSASNAINGRCSLCDSAGAAPRVGSDCASRCTSPSYCYRIVTYRGPHAAS
jgi:hypothetical protein